MIAVIADDFTGAAEIGGLGIRFQMRVEIVTCVSIKCDADLLIIVTDTRSKSSEEAISDINHITTQLMKLKPELIYKKIDSVLRGHIMVELMAQMNILGKGRALVIPANPHLGRIIKDGIYYLKDKKLHETSFKNDPEFEMSYSDIISSSNVIDILKHNNNYNVVVAKLDAALPVEGIIVGEALTTNDLLSWTKRLDHHTIIAGASSFFLALLEHLNYPLREREVEKPINYSDRKMLLVCGSSFSKSRNMVAEVLAEGAAVSLMPSALLTADGEQFVRLQEQWVSDIISLFVHHNYVIVSADPAVVYPKNLVKNIRRNTAQVVGKVMKQLPIQELMLEGGSTASSILNEIQLEKFYPQQELAHGVIRTSISENILLHITFKPGSYKWPNTIWNFKP